MMSIPNFFERGALLFGEVFPLLFLTGILIVGLMIFTVFLRFTPHHTEARHQALTLHIEGLMVLGAKLGGYQTLLTIVIVIWAVWTGVIDSGQEAFYRMVAGFLSTLLGMSFSIPAFIYSKWIHAWLSVKEREAL